MQPQNLTRIAALAVIASASTQSTSAESVFVPTPGVSTVPPAFQQLSDGDPSANETDAQLLGWLPKGLPFSYGPLTFRPHLSYNLQYGDGISASPGNQQNTTLHQISPGMLINIGEKWILDYTPTLRYYSNDAFQDGLDHRVLFSGGTEYNDWFLGLSQSYSLSEDSEVETADQTQTENFNTGLSAGRQLNSKTSLELGLAQNLRFASDGYNSYKQWSTSDYLNYQFWPKFQGGAGVSLGYIDVDEGSDMTFEQPNLRLKYTPVEKTSLVAYGGLEVRQFLDGDADDLVNPIYGGVLSYSPFDHTLLSLSVDRSVSASYYTDRVTESTYLRLSLSQRLLKRFKLDLLGSYGFSDEVSSQQSSDTVRSDDRYSFTARLSTGFMKRGGVGVFYRYYKSDSDDQNYSYDSNMIGADVSYRW